MSSFLDNTQRCDLQFTLVFSFNGNIFGILSKKYLLEILCFLEN